MGVVVATFFFFFFSGVGECGGSVTGDGAAIGPIAGVGVATLFVAVVEGATGLVMGVGLVLITALRISTTNVRDKISAL